MFERILAGLLAVIATAVMAAAPVDINKADQAQLETVKGIGPAMSAKILAERKKGSFKDWADVIDRVGGIGEGNAAKFAAGGLTVNGAGYSAAGGDHAAKSRGHARTEKAEQAEKADKQDSAAKSTKAHDKSGQKTDKAQAGKAAG